MTTPPEARVYRISREESVLVRSQSAERPAARAVGDGLGPEGGAVPQTPPTAAPVTALEAGANETRSPSVRVEVRRRAEEASRERSAQGTAAPGTSAQGNPGAGPAPTPDSAAARSGPAPDGKGAGAEAGGTPRVVATDGKAEAGPAAGAAPADDLTRAIEQVKAERLTPRQLRVAHRIARSHGIEADSDEEAVARLRLQGIDPLQRSGLRKVVADEGRRAGETPSANAPTILPQPRPGTLQPMADRLPGPPTRPNLPSREMMTEEKRAAEILKIQRDIARRRRRRMAMMFARLAAFVLLPTIIAGYYYFAIATPLYSTDSQFQIQKAEGGGTSAGGLGGLLSGTALGTNSDSVAVQSYLGSRDAMLRLDEELGFKRVFQDPSIDPLTRLEPDATDDAAYGIYKDVVKISYDPSEGVVGLEVAAPDPKLSQDFSLALIRYAEGQVDQMTARLRDDQMTGAQESYADAETKVQEAQIRIQDLQQQLGVLDPASEGQAAMSRIATLETELTKKQLELGALQANAQPNASRVRGVEGDIARLEDMIAERRSELTEASGARNSLAVVTGELRIAEGDLATRQQLLAAAAAQMESARIEANKQVRYLSLSVAPVPPDTPTYPKAWQNTLVAFLVLSGIYLMLSLTASILREQVSS